MIYDEVNRRRNTLDQEQLRKTLSVNEFEIQILESAISNLPSSYSEIIEAIYMKEVSRRELSRRLYISENTLHRRRKKAIMTIANMVSIIY